MVKRMSAHCGDETCASCVVAGDYIFLAHHAGGHDRNDISYQMEKCFESMARTLESWNTIFRYGTIWIGLCCIRKVRAYEKKIRLPE